MPLFVNRVIIAGNLTRDPESRQAGGSTVASFALAINRRYKAKDGEQREETTFIDIECWGRTAELCMQYLTKGRNVHIEGRLRQDTWEKDGQKRSKITVTADNVSFVGGPKDGERPASSAAQQRSAPAVPPPADLGSDEPPW